MKIQKEAQSLLGNEDQIISSMHTQTPSKVFPEVILLEKESSSIQSPLLEGVLIILFQITLLFREDTLS